MAQDHQIPFAFTDHFMRLTLWGQRPMPMVVMLIVTAIGGFYLSQTAGGREIYAVGGNEEAARFSGLRTKRIKLRVYAIAGLTAGIAGMVWLGRFGATSTGSAYGYELTVIAAAVVGGASLTGGKGTALGRLYLGAIIIAMIQDGIITLHRKAEYQIDHRQAPRLLLAVAIDKISEVSSASAPVVPALRLPFRQDYFHNSRRISMREHARMLGETGTGLLPAGRRIAGRDARNCIRHRHSNACNGATSQRNEPFDHRHGRQERGQRCVPGGRYCRAHRCRQGAWRLRYGVAIEIEWRTPPNEDPAAQADAINSLTNEKVDGDYLVLLGGSDALTPAINGRAVDKGGAGGLF